MRYRISKGNTLQPDIFPCNWGLRKSLGKVLGKPELLVVGVRGNLQLEEWTVSTLGKEKNILKFIVFV